MVIFFLHSSAGVTKRSAPDTGEKETLVGSDDEIDGRVVQIFRFDRSVLLFSFVGHRQESQRSYLLLEPSRGAVRWPLRCSSMKEQPSLFFLIG